MCCFFTSLLAFGPRLALVIWWIIWTDRFSLVFESVLWPILGILFLPWTTLAYLTVWQPEGSFEGWAVFVLVLGVFMDLFTHLGGGFRNRRRFRR